MYICIVFLDCKWLLDRKLFWRNQGVVPVVFPTGWLTSAERQWKTAWGEWVGIQWDRAFNFLSSKALAMSSVNTLTWSNPPRLHGLRHSGLVRAARVRSRSRVRVRGNPLWPVRSGPAVQTISARFHLVLWLGCTFENRGSLDGYVLCSYDGPLLDDKALLRAAEGGLSSHEYVELCRWLATRLKPLWGLEESIVSGPGKTTSSRARTRAHTHTWFCLHVNLLINAVRYKDQKKFHVLLHRSYSLLDLTAIFV